MKKLFLLFLFIFAFALPVNAFNPLMVCTDAVASSCTTATDEALDVPTTQPGTEESPVISTARKFVLSSQKTITCYKIRQFGHGDDGSIRVVIMNHDAANDYPDETSEVASSAVTKDMSNVVLADTVNDYVLGTTITLSAGTYWIVDQEVDGADRETFWAASSGDRACYSLNGTTWDCFTDTGYDMEIWGCD